MQKIPKHVAIIMDGNGRWAKKRFLPRIMGHQSGVQAVERAIRFGKNRGIEILSFYAFSTENWRRPVEEISGLMGLFRYFTVSKLRAMREEGVRIRFVGRVRDLPEDVYEILRRAEEETRECSAIRAYFCLNYGGRQEILDAVASILKESPDSLPEKLTEEAFSRYLYVPDLPDPDLLIRTSGENRLSNFWLWQSAYSELYFTDVLWPDFGDRDFEEALEAYGKRERRYGGTEPSAP
ncbi:MAG TPA: polyprenyl diphosphate synthase [Synergistaceae bacterium]|nr:polyprenyl diphosphate synthase [Synergistaceae bacterium]HPJ25106.1 polyprenyl diphosphate synthase [Synergistaceae bacterium]HPQ36585.1 polyprenyl diphosphate synthase [Synergistaceae bacterium]